MEKNRKVNQNKYSNLPQVLVAGGAGFIGSYLCQTLLSQNCVVYCFDNLTTGKKKNLKNFWNNNNFFFVQHDLNQTIDAKSLPKFDYIFHLAGIEAYINSQNISLEMLLVNSLGTKNLLELAKECKAKFLLGSSCKVYEGFLSASQLIDYFGKRPESDGYYSHSEAKRFSEALTFEYFKTYSLDARIVRIADVYGPRMNLARGEELGNLFLEVKENKNLSIAKNDLKILHPTYISDLVWGILKAMFGQATKSHIYSIVNQEEITVLDFAKKLITLSKKNLSIEHKTPPTPQKAFVDKEEILKTSQMLNWQPKVSLDKGIKETLGWIENKPESRRDKIDKVDKKVKQEVVDKKRSRKVQKSKKIQLNINKQPFLKFSKLKLRLPKLPFGFKKIHLLIFFLLFFTILSPALFFCLNVFKGVRNLQNAKNYLYDYDFEKGNKEAFKAYQSFQNTKATLVEFSWLSSALRLTKSSQEIYSLLEVGSSISKTILETVEAVGHAENMLAIVMKGETGSVKEESQLLAENLGLAYEQLGFLKTSLEDDRQPVLDLKILGISQKFEKIKKNVEPARKIIETARQFLNLMPEVLAFDHKKTYLVLLQNNMELRATGGFIGSYAFLTFEKGKLLDFKVEDVYSADGQLKGFVKPPEAIKKYLGEDIWYFRDSNFDPHFPTSALQAEWFVQKELGRKVDGVLGINLSSAQNLLSVLGPVQLPDYEELITSDNIFERAEYHSEVNFFPGSTQKKDFLAALSLALFEKVKQIKDKEWLNLTKALAEAFEKKQILLYLHDKKTAEFVNFRGWDGGIRQISSYSLPAGLPPMVKDYQMIVESNFGVNKTNYFVKREIDHKVVIHKQGEINENLTINYENTSQSESWPGGRYKNYLRVYIPPDTKLVKTMIGKTKETLKSVPNNKVDNYFKNGKRVVGFLVEVPAREKRIVQVDYQLDKKITFQNKQFSYALFVQKQPGVKDDSFDLEISYPGFVTPLKVVPEASVLKQLIKFSGDTSKDKLFVVDFAK